MCSRVHTESLFHKAENSVERGLGQELGEGLSWESGGCQSWLAAFAVGETPAVLGAPCSGPAAARMGAESGGEGAWCTAECGAVRPDPVPALSTAVLQRETKSEGVLRPAARPACTTEGVWGGRAAVS